MASLLFEGQLHELLVLLLTDYPLPESLLQEVDNFAVLRGSRYEYVDLILALYRDFEGSNQIKRFSIELHRD